MEGMARNPSAEKMTRAASEQPLADAYSTAIPCAVALDGSLHTWCYLAV